MKTPAKNEDLRRYETKLTAAERAEAVRESKLVRSIYLLGKKYVFHPHYNGQYDPETLPRPVR
jgi:hypothetical protein